MRNETVNGVVFNIQHYAIHDGPGIRTTVFLKGCPLGCLWCQNPESQDLKPVIFFNAEKCTGCGMCTEVCPENAIQIVAEKSVTDRSRCKGTGECAAICPNEARSLMGRTMSGLEVFEDVNADAVFYQNSGGGVTLSGGDPVAQPAFATDILKRCQNAGIHTAVETCGFAKWQTLKNILRYVDLVLYDIKHMDPVKHRAFTNVSNELILDNAKKIRRQLELPMLARIPVIPGYNDSPDMLKTAAQFIARELGTAVNVHLLPYHRLGEAKYERLEKPGQRIRIVPPEDSHMQEVKGVFAAEGLTVYIGG
ncbi:MAG: glycyl-radical enzyme activating protein [Deltaproteobacteria bacterium]|nr:glycyl-radical enzyme activating protein [Deltaproteobacteria bacterium]